MKGNRIGYYVELALNRLNINDVTGITPQQFIASHDMAIPERHDYGYREGGWTAHHCLICF